MTQWLNYSEVGGGTLNSDVNVELVPAVKFSRKGAERRPEVVERQLLERRSGPFWLNLTTAMTCTAQYILSG